MKTRLTERDLNRIVRRVVREGVIIPSGPNHTVIDTQYDLAQFEGQTGTFKVQNENVFLYGADNKVILEIMGGTQQISPK